MKGITAVKQRRCAQATRRAPSGCPTGGCGPRACGMARSCIGRRRGAAAAVALDFWPLTPAAWCRPAPPPAGQHHDPPVWQKGGTVKAAPSRRPAHALEKGSHAPPPRHGGGSTPGPSSLVRARRPRLTRLPGVQRRRVRCRRRGRVERVAAQPAAVAPHVRRRGSACHWQWAAYPHQRRRLLLPRSRHRLRRRGDGARRNASIRDTLQLPCRPPTPTPLKRVAYDTVAGRAAATAES